MLLEDVDCKLVANKISLMMYHRPPGVEPSARGKSLSCVACSVAQCPYYYYYFCYYYYYYHYYHH